MHDIGMGSRTWAAARRVVGRPQRRASALAIALSFAAMQSASGQFGMLRKVKDRVSGGDSASRAADSVARSQAVAEASKTKSPAPVATADTSTEGTSRFARAKAAAVRASDKFEKVTGVSTKDAALAVSGAGVANLAAKKLGVDPMSLATKAMNRANEEPMKRASPRGSPTGSALGGLTRGGSANGTPGMQQMMLMRGMSSSGAPSADYAPTTAEAEAMLAFQQEMVQVAMAANTGDATARARLESWNAVMLRHHSEMESLSTSAGTGDVASMQKLQLLQLTMMKEWSQTSRTKRPAGTRGTDPAHRDHE